MEVIFWGVRGSLPTPGPTTVGVGGNTSCVEIRAGGERLVLDAGTGLKGLGDQRMAEGNGDLTLLLSHLHWDHIQGLPFYTPLFRPDTTVKIFGHGEGTGKVEDAIAAQMKAPSFPIAWSDLPCKVESRTLVDGDSFSFGDVHVRCARLNHPGGVLAYRVEHEGHSVVYATDTEQNSELDHKLVELARDVDILVLDAMYSEAEYLGDDGGGSRIGWGHSSWEWATRIAKEANVGQLALFHHDPSRNDQQVAEIEQLAKAEFPNSVAAREGRILLAERDADGAGSAAPQGDTGEQAAQVA